MSLPTTIAVLALAVVLTAAATPPNGDPGRFMAQAWTTEDGLPQSSVNDLVQTSDGYLWIATFGGLARFDGVEFESFGTARHTDLPSNRILSLVDAEDGTLWVGTEMSGIVFLKDGVFHTFEPPDGLGLQGVAEIHIGPSGTIWIGTAYDLLRLRPNGDFKRFTIDDGLAQPPVYTVLEETDGTVWLGGQGGVSVLRENHIESVTHAGNPVSWVQAILRSRSGELLVGAAEGLFRLLPGRELEPKPLPDNPNLQEVSALLEDRDGGLWIGTLRHGLFLSVKGSLRNIGLEAGHTFNDTTALFEDAEGTLWVGTSADGLFQLNPCKFSSVGGAPLNVSTTSITDDGRGGLWIGTNCHGLAHLESGEITILGEPQGLATNCIWSVLRSQNGDLYIGTFNDGLYRLRDSILEILDGPATSGSEISIRALDEAADGSLLVGTNDGAFRFDPATSTFTPIDGTADLLVYFITQDQEDRLWLGTHTGLHIVSGQRHDIW
ncbi:MAG: two-component regulator propeller domain-containing protein, partial [Acidobacteriota bacterium]